jgi:hypothetical protein
MASSALDNLKIRRFSESLFSLYVGLVPRRINAMDLKDVLGQIEPNCRDR